MQVIKLNLAIMRFKTKIKVCSVQNKVLLNKILNMLTIIKTGNMGLAFNLTQQLIQLLPGGQTELINILESENRLRASFIKETAYANHDEDYKALCR